MTENLIAIEGAKRLLSNYVDKLESPVTYPQWHLFGTRTFRLTSTNPNVMGFSNDPMVQQCFVAPVGRVWIVADYCQLEARVLAELSGDLKLQQIFWEKLDLHSEVAKVIGADRNTAKRFFYALVYGATESGLSAIVGKDVNIEAFWSEFHFIRPFMDFVRQEMRSGKVSLGRGLYMLCDKEEQFRTVWNAVMQFWSIVTLEAAERLLDWLDVHSCSIHMTKHDAIYLTIPIDTCDEIEDTLRKEMCKDYIPRQMIPLDIVVQGGKDLSRLEVLGHGIKLRQQMRRWHEEEARYSCG